MKHYKYGYWVGYDEVERIARGDLEPSSKEAVEPTRSAGIVEPNTAGEVRG